MKIFGILILYIASVSAANLDAVAQPAFASGRIINGYEAQRGEAPYIVSLKRLSHFCAGSIIDANWVLTAGHCLMYDNFEIVAGLHSLTDESYVQIRTVTNKSQYIIHEQYSGGVGPYDIGLIYIPIGFDLNSLTANGIVNVAKVSLPTGKYESTGKGRLYGWGIDNSGHVPNKLQTLDVNIIGYKECKDLLPLLAPIADANICTYNAKTSDGACNGDSGGPLIQNNEEDIELVGIVSWGYIPCTSTEYPSVYTDVSSYSEWIAKRINATHEI